MTDRLAPRSASTLTLEHDSYTSTGSCMAPPSERRRLYSRYVACAKEVTLQDWHGVCYALAGRAARVPAGRSVVRDANRLLTRARFDAMLLDIPDADRWLHELRGRRARLGDHHCAELLQRANLADLIEARVDGLVAVVLNLDELIS